MSWLDWFVIAVYAALMLGIGTYYSRRNESEEDYLLGGRSMSPVMVGLSLFATLLSTLSYLAWPGEMIAHGPIIGLGQMVAYPFIIVIVGWGLIPFLMRQKVTSAYEILETRLGSSVRMAGAGVFLMLRLGWMATILYATSDKVLVPVLKLDHGDTPWLCALLGLVTVIYSAAGGLRAVVMTDALQSLTMIAGAVLSIAAITVQLGGVEAWWPRTWPSHWETPSWGFGSAARASFLPVVLSTIVWYVCTNGSDQMSIQRFLSTRDAKAARKTLMVAMLSDLVVTCLLALTGVAVLGYFQVHAPVLKEGQTLVTIADQLFPRLITTVLPSGLSGLVIAALLAAAMSSLSSGINSTCAVIEKDFLPRLSRTPLSPQLAVSRMRRLSWVIGVVSVLLSILNTFLAGNLLERCYKVVNLLTAPLFVLFFLALFVPWATAGGAWLGLISAVATAVTIAFFHGSLGISFVWMMPASLLVGITIGTLASAVATALGGARFQPIAPEIPEPD